MSNNKQSILKKMQLDQLETSNNAAKQYLNRFRSAELRKKFLESQKLRQYQSEYNRLRSIVADSQTKGSVLPREVYNRQLELRKLGKNSLDLIY